YTVHYSGDGNFNPSDSATETLTVNKAQLSITTTIHDADTNGSPTSVLGEKVYDTANVTGQFDSFAIGAISFTFNGADATQAGGGTQSVTEGPLQAGDYVFKASVAGNDDYIGATSDDEPLHINKADTSTSTVIELNGTETEV